jgi:Peptidase family S51
VSLVASYRSFSPVGPIKPIFLLADSQLLFWRIGGRLFLERVRAALRDEMPAQPIKATYLGASNRDAPEYYELFVAAMDGIRIRDCRMIPSLPSDDDRAYLAEADLVLLAGGVPDLGWDTFVATGLDRAIFERYYQGAVLIGVSAGAVQLGMCGWRGDDIAAGEHFDAFQLVPLVIDAHDEPDWRRLSRLIRALGGVMRGIGIPSGSGAIFHPDGAIEPIRHPLVELTPLNDMIGQALLWPPVADG